MKKFVSIILIMCSLFTLVACGGKKNSDNDTLTIAATSDYGTLDVIHNGFPSDYVWAAEMYAEPLWEIIDTNTKNGC